ncbi:MAG: hypothetical protein ACLP05_14100, partial [Candidatus Kryptoniota bacterium]
GIFLQYVDDHYGQPTDNLAKEYRNAENFDEKFQVGSDALDDIFIQAQKSGVKISKDEYKREIVYVDMLIKAHIARNVWGNNGWYRVLLSDDSQFQKALMLFPEARQIAGID